jgi:hypothetical protein
LLAALVFEPEFDAERTVRNPEIVLEVWRAINSMPLANNF